MPWWLPIYFLAVVTVTVLATRDEIEDKEPIAMTVAELIAVALLLVAGLAYWFEPVRSLLSTTAPFVYVAGLSWFGLSAFREIRKLKPDSELSPRLNLASVVIGISLFIALYSPLVYWGFIYAFQGLHNGA
jgi:hypothetical protein